METKPIPAIVMLIAGFVTCVISVYTHMDLKTFLKTLFWVLVIFLGMGILIKFILDRNFKGMEQEGTGEQAEGEGIATEQSESQEQDDPEQDGQAPEVEDAQTDHVEN